MPRPPLLPFVLVCVCSAAAAEGPCDDASAAIPGRPASAAAGSEFVAGLGGAGDAERDAAVREALVAGNVPEFLRRLRPVVVRRALAGGIPHALTLCVMPDYLAVGDDDDFVRVPLGLPSALAVAARFGLVLPTRRIVDLVYRAAAVRLAPLPLPAGDAMRTIGYVWRHQLLVEAERHAIGARVGELTAGQKKDLVLTPRLRQFPGRVAIYGWHRADGLPIQPLSTVHGERYADYSHGVRLVGERVWIDGAPRSIFDVLADPVLAPLVSDEGPFAAP